MLKRILVGVDGTASSWRALEYACGLAALSKGTLIVLTVQEDGGQDILNQAHAIMDGREEIEVEYVLENGAHPASKILEVEKRENCDSIVTGTRGLGTVEALLRSSVSQTLLEEADVPVIVVK
jgi:nucleotide-binding universal stress UspA family protein